MANSCNPKDYILDCRKSGTGPECSRDTNLSQASGFGAGSAKAECMDQVKQDCDEYLKSCIEKCQTDGVSRMDKLIEDDKESVAEATQRQAEIRSKCESTPAYQEAIKNANKASEGVISLIDIGGYRFPNDKVPAPYDEYPFTNPKYQIPRDRQDDKTYGGLAPGKGEQIDGDYRLSSEGIVAKNEPKTSAYMIKNVTLDNLNLQVKDAIINAAYADIAPRAICPRVNVSVPSLTTEDNPCYEQQRRDANSDIHRCVAQCFTAVIGYRCYRAKCNCDSLDCGGSVGGNSGAGDTGRSVVEPGAPPATAADSLKLTLTASSYGLPIEWVFGEHFLPGNILWIDADSTVSAPSDIPRYDPSGNIYTTDATLIARNTIDLFVGVAAGEIDDVPRIWFDDVLVYDTISNRPLLNSSVRVYTGSETQKVQQRQAINEGFGRVPAYRGVAGVLFTDLDLTTFDAFPSFKFHAMQEVVSQAKTSVPVVPTGAIKVDMSARELLVGTTSGTKRFNYDTLDLIDTSAGTSPVHYTSLSYPITLSAGVFTLDGRGTAVADRDASFVYRHVDANGYAAERLAVYCAGTITEFDIDDQAGTLTQSADYALPFTPDAIVTSIATYTDNLGITHSTLFRRIVGVDGNNIVVNNDPLISTQSTLPATSTSTIGFSSPPTVRSVVQVTPEYTLIFGEYAGGKFIVNNTVNGDVWHADVEYLPNNQSNRSAAFGANASTYSFLSDGYVHTIDLASGQITSAAIDVSVSAPNKFQFFDQVSDDIVYFAADGTLKRESISRVEFDQSLTVGDIIRAILERAGIPAYLIDVDLDTPLRGYRSGGNLTVAAMLDDILSIVLATVYNDSRLTIHALGGSPVGNVDPDDTEDGVHIERVLEAYTRKLSSITYYSQQLSGLEQTQSFRLPDADSLSTTVTVRSNVLADDAAMAELAELLVFSEIESDTRAKMKVGPKYLYLIPSDVVTIDSEYRLTETTIGADFTSEFTFIGDSISKYGNRIAGYARTNTVEDTFHTSVGAPMVFRARSINTTDAFSSSIFIGVSDDAGEANDPALLSIGYDEFVNTPTGNTLTGSPAYGVLLTPPPSTTTPFTTQTGASMVVKFHRPEDVDAIIPILARKYQQASSARAPYEQFWMYRTFTDNLILVGKEWMQFARAVVDPDGVTVTLSNLARARFSTDAFTAHTAGETVVLYSSLNLIEKPITPELSGRALKIGTMPDYSGDYRRVKHLDAYADPAFLTPLGAYAAMRVDYVGGLDKDIFISFDGRNQLYLTVTDDFFGATPRTLEAKVYLLRAAYDESLFNLYKDDLFDTSYVMYRDDSSLMVYPDGSRRHGISWLSYGQSAVGWDQGDGLCAVVVVTDGVREHRLATYWPPSDYTGRRVRGLNG